MHNQKTPVYAVCAAGVAEQMDFFNRYCKAKQPLLVQMGNGESESQTGNPMAWQMPCSMPPEALGLKLAQLVKRSKADAVWIFWNDDAPVEQLLLTVGQMDFARCCKLKRIVRCGDGEEILSGLGNTNLQRQLAQCDLVAVSQSARRYLRKLRHRVMPLQPNIKVTSLYDSKNTAAALEQKSLWRNLQYGLLIVLVAALFITLGRLHFSWPDTLATFLGTYLQALPFLMLGIFLSSAIQVFVPADLLQRIFPKRLLPGMLFGVLGGFILPICDCASIPVFRSLVRKGVPLPAAVTFMIAAPIINPVVLLSTFYAFGGSVPIMLTRMSFGIVCSVLIGLFFAWEKKSVFLAGQGTTVCACGVAHGDAEHQHEEHMHAHDHGHEHEHEHEHEHHHHDTACACEHEHNHEHHHHDAACACGHEHSHEESHQHDGAVCSCGHVHHHASDHPDETEVCACGHVHAGQHTHTGWRGRMMELVSHFQAEFFEVARFLLLGIGVSTVLQLVMGSRIMNLNISNLAVAMLVMMALAFFLSLCSSSDAVVGKNMGASLPLGAVMSFMVFGPMIDVKNMILMAASFTKRFMVKLLLVTFAVSFITVYIAFTLGLRAWIV